MLVRKAYATKQEKARDFWVGFGGGLVANLALGGLAWGLIYLFYQLFEPETAFPFAAAAALLPVLANVVGLIYIGTRRKWLSVGALVAIGALLAIGLVTALTFFFTADWS